MLVGLSIRDVVLIDRLDIAFHPGLSVLTGETGAGKSILLDALGLALGARAEVGLLREGAAQASVTAAFEPAAGHPVWAILGGEGLAREEPLLLRRVLAADGRSRAFVNDQPVSVGLLRRLGDSLVEIQGQLDQHGLLDPASHRAALDAFGGHAVLVAAVAAADRAWRAARAAEAAFSAELEETRREEEFLRHALAEFAGLDPKPGEEAALAEERTLLMHREQVIDALNASLALLGGEPEGRGEGRGEGHGAGRGEGLEATLGRARRQLERAAEKAGGRLDAALAALDRAGLELGEAVAALQAFGSAVDAEPGRLEAVDERLYALRDLARKHQVPPEALPGLRERFAARLAAIDEGSEARRRHEERTAAARADYVRAATALSAARADAAARLDRAVAAELPPLKLEAARFATRLAALEEADWGEHGLERVAFEVATNPGTAMGPIARIASGGELARFMLALKVVLSRVGAAPTLVFDEVDSGIGGATAAAVGERLQRLGRELQVLVVTHSPQVAARGVHHWRVSKDAGGRGGAAALTLVEELAAAARREEIARMLSGRRVTDAARAAADSLIAASAR